jgi:hypothetical protein
MKTRFLLGIVLLAVAGASWGADLYRWVDGQGKVHYTDRPPPASARQVQQKRLVGNVIESDKLPYAVRMAAEKHPVVLFVTNCGAPCDQARSYLKGRGIPFTTTNPETPAGAAAMKKLIGGLEVPVLQVGDAPPLKGYQASSWAAALDAAGYPQSGPARQ